MGKDTKILPIISITAFICTVLFIVFITSATKKEEKVQAPLDSQPREISNEVDFDITPSDEQFDEKEAVVRRAKIGTKEVSKGLFVKIENGAVFYQNEGITYTMALKDGDVVLACTNQDLNAATTLDYYEITKINVYSREELASNIPVNEMIAVFAEEQEEGGHKAHSIAIDASKCE